MSLGTLRQELLADLHILASATDVNRKILAAMRFHRDKKLWFSERTFSLSLVAGQSAYTPGNGPPADMVEIVGRVVWVLIDGSQNQRLPCVRVTTAEFEDAKRYGTSQDRPSIWDFYGKQLRFYPIPSSSTDTVEGRYVTDLGVPQVKYDTANSAFTFYDPSGTRLLSPAELDAYTSDWLEQSGAYHLIRTRTASMLCREVLKDNEQADALMNHWLEQVASMEEETDARTSGATEIAPCLLDGW